MKKEEATAKEIKDFIVRHLAERGEVTEEKLEEIIGFHFKFRSEKEKSTMTRRALKEMLAHPIDEAGRYHRCRIRGLNVYVDLETTSNATVLSYLEEQSNMRLAKLIKLHKKAQKRKEELLAPHQSSGDEEPFDDSGERLNYDNWVPDEKDRDRILKELRENWEFCEEEIGPEEAEEAKKLYKKVLGNSLLDCKEDIQDYFTEMYCAVNGQLEKYIGDSDREMVDLIRLTVM